MGRMEIVSMRQLGMFNGNYENQEKLASVYLTIKVGNFPKDLTHCE